MSQMFCRMEEENPQLNFFKDCERCWRNISDIINQVSENPTPLSIIQIYGWRQNKTTANSVDKGVSLEPVRAEVVAGLRLKNTYEPLFKSVHFIFKKSYRALLVISLSGIR